jgi:hypothetical protein
MPIEAAPTPLRMARSGEGALIPLQAQAVAPRTPYSLAIVGLTANAMACDREECLRAGRSCRSCIACRICRALNAAVLHLTTLPQAEDFATLDVFAQKRAHLEALPCATFAALEVALQEPDWAAGLQVLMPFSRL